MTIFIYPRKLVSAKGYSDIYKRRQIYEYRLMASKVLGKPLPKKCQVHHYRDFYILCQDQAYHLLLHARQRAYEATGDPHKRKCYICKQYEDLENLKIRYVRQTQQYYHNTCNTEKARHYKAVRYLEHRK